MGILVEMAAGVVDRAPIKTFEMVALKTTPAMGSQKKAENRRNPEKEFEIDNEIKRKTVETSTDPPKREEECEDAFFFETMNAIRVNFRNLQPRRANASGGKHMDPGMGCLLQQIKNRRIGHDGGPHLEKLD
jgi:hypothetical protein